MSYYDFGVGGYDITVDCQNITEGNSLYVVSDIGITEADSLSPLNAQNKIQFEKFSDHFILSWLDKSGVVIDSIKIEHTTLGTVRVFFHNEFVSVYARGRWIYTFAAEKVSHLERATVTLESNVTLFADASRRELSDWREAIWIDIESTAQNAIGSVILQRPVEIYSNQHGQLVFVYDPVRSVIAGSYIHRYARREQDALQACSDAIVYFTAAAVVIDPVFVWDTGFVTRIYRYPNLDNGAIRAAQIGQESARESQIVHEIETRIMPKLEVGDIVTVDETVAGYYQQGVEFALIVEQMRIDISQGRGVMSVSGRNRDLNLL